MKKIVIVILLTLGFLALTARPVVAFEAHTISVTARIELPEDPSEPPEKDLSHWVLGLCGDHQVERAYPKYSGPATDPTSNVYGIKWDTPSVYDENKTKSGATYVVELDGWWELGNVATAVKAGAGHDPVTGEILGASCTSSATQPEQPTATGSTVLDGWKIVLLRATYTDDSKTVLEYWVGPANQDVPQTYSDIALNEFLADPSGPEPDSEWVEVYNLSGSPIDIDGWVLYDEYDSQDLVIDSSHTGGSTMVPAGGLLRITHGSGSSFSLNNDTDVIRLYDGDKDAAGTQLIVLVRYFEALEDKTWKRKPDDYAGYGVWVDPPLTPEAPPAKEGQEPEPESEPEPDPEPEVTPEPEPEPETESETGDVAAAVSAALEEPPEASESAKAVEPDPPEASESAKTKEEGPPDET